MTIIPKKIDIRDSNRVQTILLTGLFVMFAIASLIGLSLILIFTERLEHYGDTYYKDIFGLTQIGLLIFAGLMIFYPTTLIYQLVQHFSIKMPQKSKEKDNNRIRNLNEHGSFLNAIAKSRNS